jgi:hypothetical protein
MTGTDALSKQADIAKQGVEKAVANFRELTHGNAGAYQRVEDRAGTDAGEYGQPAKAVAAEIGLLFRLMRQFKTATGAATRQ